MLKRVSRGFGGKKAQKFHLNVFVEKLDNLPSAVKRCRVVWSRGAKVQMTDVKDVAKGAVAFKQQLSQIATMYMDAKQGGFEPKEYKFQVQVPAKGDEAKLMTVGKADIDLSFFVLALGQPQNKLIPIMFKVGTASTGYLKVIITAELVTGDLDDDGLTEISGMTGLNHLTEEQDLSGFNEDGEEETAGATMEASRQSPAPGGSGKSLSRFATSSPSPAAPPAAAAASSAAQAKASEAKDPGPGHGRTMGSNTSTKALAAAVDDDDDGDISPVSLSPTQSSELLPAQGSATTSSSREAGKPSIVGTKGARAAATAAASAAAKDARTELFSNGPSSSSRSTASKRGAVALSSSNRSIPDMTDDEARSELFSGGVKPTASTSAQANTRAGPSSSSNPVARSRRTPSATSSSRSNSSQPPVAHKAAAVVSSSASSSDAGTSIPSAAATSTVASSAAAASHKGLLDRTRVKGAQAAAAAAAPAESAAPAAAQASAAAAESISAEEGSSKNASGVWTHSLSESDDDAAAEELGCTSQPLKAPVISNRQSAASRIPHLSATQEQRLPAVAGTAGGASNVGTDSATYKQLAADNEKLRAQLVALRDQATQAEDARRQARLAAENAAAERDAYKEQAQELQQQLKEAIVGMLSPEEGEELQHRVEQLQQLSQQQESQLEQLQCQAQQRQHGDPQGEQQREEQLVRLNQQLEESRNRVDQLQQQLQAQTEHDEQLQQQLHLVQGCTHELEQCMLELDTLMAQQQDQLQSQLSIIAELEQHLADAQSHAAQAEQQNCVLELKVLELAQELEATQQLLQQQQEAAAAHATSLAKPRSSEHDVPALSNIIVDLRVMVAAMEQRAAAADKKWNAILAVLLDAAKTATEQPDIKQHMNDGQLLAAATASLAFLDGDVNTQEDVQLVLLALKAAAAAAVAQAGSQAQLNEEVSLLKTGFAEIAAIHQAHSQLGEQQQQHEQQPSMAEQQTVQLEAGLSDSEHDRMQFTQRKQQQQVDWNNPPSNGQLGLHGDKMEQHQGPLIHAPTKPSHVADTSSACQEELVHVRQQLAHSRHKAQQLAKARDKLEIILHDFEAAASEEKEQMLVQLSAANQAVRQIAQQHEQAQQQLAKSQQALAVAECQLGETGHQLSETRRQLELLERRLAQAQQQLATSVEQQQQLEQRVAAAESAAAAGASGLQVQQVISMAESVGPSGMQEALAAAQQQVADLQKQLAEAEAGRRRTDKGVERLSRQLAEEQAERAALEEQLAQKLEDTDDYMAQDAVAAYEAKYSRLNTRYRELTESHHEEVEQLHEEISSLQERMVDLEAAAAQLEATRSLAQHGEVTLSETLAKSSKAASELTALRSENQSLMQELVAAKLELAQCSEREIVSRRELYKAKETNMKLASKMTKLETLVYRK